MGPSTEELRSEIAAKREDIGRDIETIEDRVMPGRIIHRRQTAFRMKAQGVRDKVMGVRDAAGGALHNAGGGVTHAAGNVTHAAHATGSSAQGAAQGNPLVAGIVAFGAGVIVSSLLPPSQAERNAASRAQHALEGAAAELGSAGHQVVEEVKPAAKQAVGEVQEHAQESMSSVKEGAKEARSDVTS